MGLKVYVDFSVLNTLAFSPSEGSANPPYWQPVRNTWRRFIDNEISLVSSSVDLEMDIILWLNKKGCCITDTMRAIEAIDEFERCNMIEKDKIRRWKRIFVFYEQIDFLKDNEYMLFDDAQRALESLIQNEILGFRHDETAFLLSDEDINILNECSQSLHNWYNDLSWKDLKRTDYQLNWQILLSVLEKRGIKTVFEGDQGEKNRNLFGLWNRIVGLSKKSSGKLPLDKTHIDFVLATVLKKYQFKRANSDARHIMNCVRHKIDFFMTTDDKLVESFNNKKHLYIKEPGHVLANLNIVSPSNLEMRLQTFKRT